MPTTPFLLLAAGCYVRSSMRMYRWLLAQPGLGRHLQPALEKKALPRNVKVISLVFAWGVLGNLALFVAESTIAKALLIVLALAKTGIMLRIRTL
ncbi:MAG: YbaN family protein, partial [Acidobacteria bacterium]|nr:YbaN family protein [Acidobacteriota bacterium]